MPIKEWPGIPKKYWPSSAKPWRITWGIGNFADFATKEEAQRKAEKLRKEFKEDGPTVRDVFNAYEMEVDDA
jgi:hypothetical protein